MLVNCKAILPQKSRSNVNEVDYVIVMHSSSEHFWLDGDLLTYSSIDAKDRDRKTRLKNILKIK